ncbi:uncharacterized protein [Hemitrygon akajei]|uniref:uncharacterized protein n=1 Tax=Hemitrygon akajei TaxID=2704970 RepID=UPI003BF95D19
MLDTEMSNDLPAQSSQQEISDNESTPEINLITGALITSCISTQERRIAFADEPSVGNRASNMPSLLSSHNSLVESFNISKAETTNATRSSLSQALPQEEISAQGNLEKNTSSKSTSNEILIMDLLRPLSNESRSSSLTTINLSPLMDSLDALSDGAATTESLAERQDALPVELLAAINKMPLMTTVLPINGTLSSFNEKLAINSSTQDNLELKACMFTLPDNNTEINEDLTQITDNEPNLEPSRELEHLQEKNIEFSNDKNKDEADTSKYELMDKLTERQTCNVSNVTLTTPSHQDNVAGATNLRRSSRKRVATNSTFPCCGSSVCENHKLQFHTRSKDIKRKAVITDHEEPSHKLLEYTGEKKMPTLQNTHTVVKNKLEHRGQQGMCNKLIHNNNIRDSKINDTFSTKLLCSKLQSRELFANSQEYVKISTRSHRGKDRENIAEVETKSKQKDIQHRTTSAMKAHQSSRAEKGSNMSCHDKCQDEPRGNTAKPEDEPIITRSASNIATILKCRKTMKRKNIYGETKLHEAAFNGNVNLLHALIQAGANVNLPDYAGWTALHEASNNGFHEAVLVLLSAGADVNSKGLNGITPLQDAVRNGHSQVVKLLLQHGADPFEKNDHGICALDEALDNHMKQLMKSYQQRKAAVKVGGNRHHTRNRDLKSTVASKIEQEF